MIQIIGDIDSEIGAILIVAESTVVPILEAILERQDLLNRIIYIFAATHERYFPQLLDNYDKIEK